ncbi:preprotein translocase subunit SecG [Gynuella sp.]|jgi:preprotein translocase subunit SecG|uniref:preprotein translocase subunit SecG n=1 Tax=Gynuella sp. TaxID=2969146 RepID=UPI003D0EFF5C
MQDLNAILLVVQVLLSVSLIALILLQHGKGADAGAAFGSGASATVFGAKGSGNFLTKSTAILATLFFLTCLALAYMSSHREGPASLVDSIVETQAVEQSAPVMKQTETTTDLPPTVEDPAVDAAPAQTDLPPSE